jgi:hypothetical protein
MNLAKIFENGLRDLVGISITQSTYIHGSIFHLGFAVSGGVAELVCNGCQWVVLNEKRVVLLHDESALSSEALSDIFTGNGLLSYEISPGSIALHFDDVVFHAFATEDYHLFLHDGVALGSDEWLELAGVVRDSFMLMRPGCEAVGYEFSEYFDLKLAPWGAHYLSAQESSLG